MTTKPARLITIPFSHYSKTCADVMAFEKVCSEELGVATRLNAYHYGLGNVPALLRRVAPSLTATQRIAMRVVMPFVGPLIRRKYRVSEANAARARVRRRRACSRWRASGSRRCRS